MRIDRGEYSNQKDIEGGGHTRVNDKFPYYVLDNSVNGAFYMFDNEEELIAYIVQAKLAGKKIGSPEKWNGRAWLPWQR